MWGQEDVPGLILERYLKGHLPFPCKALKAASFLCYSGLFLGKRRKNPDLPAKIWGGGLRNPQNVLLRNLEARKMGRAQGAGISDPPL